MRVDLLYGKDGLSVDLPDSSEADITVIEPEYKEGLADEKAAIEEALDNPIGQRPLRDLATEAVFKGERVVVVFSDITRPVPNKRILPPILRTLEEAGLSRERITLLNATGLHRPNTEAELIEILGEEIVSGGYLIVNHDAHERGSLESVGATRAGNEVFLNKEYTGAGLRILTGFVEPHFFAGFSGGAKSLLPGIAGEETILRNHGFGMLANPRATWAVTNGNPLFEEIREAHRLAPATFVVNVTQNRDRKITGVFAGDLIEAHDRACERAQSEAMRPVDRPFDIVITTNSGYPLDLNLYQAVKGMSAGSGIVRDGGAIIAAAECREGIGHGAFEEILAMADSPRKMLEILGAPGFSMVDGWEAQMLANILVRARVFLYSDKLTDDQLKLAGLDRSSDVGATLRELIGQYGRRVAVLPQGPLTIPYLSERPLFSLHKS